MADVDGKELCRADRYAADRWIEIGVVDAEPTEAGHDEQECPVLDFVEATDVTLSKVTDQCIDFPDVHGDGGGEGAACRLDECTEVIAKHRFGDRDGVNPSKIENLITMTKNFSKI